MADDSVMETAENIPSEPKDATTTEDMAVEGEEEEADDDYQVQLVRPEKKLQRPERLSVPELLSLRQGFGVSQLALPPFARPRTLTTSTLASKIAWNPSRLQNMILTVGPGTPAAIVDLTVNHREPPPPDVARLRNEEDASSSSSSSESSSSSSEDQEDDELEEDEDSSPATPEQQSHPAPTHSRSGSSSGSSRSSGTTSPKRTLSDRIKLPEEEAANAAEQQQEAQTTAAAASMNLDTTTDDDDGDDDDGEEEEEDQEHDNEAADDRSGNNQGDTESASGKQEQSCTKKAKASSDDEAMMGYSDVEGEFSAQEDVEEEAAEAEELPELTDRERFLLALNQAEEHRMQFSEDEDEDKSGCKSNDDGDEEDEARMAESTDDDDDDDNGGGDDDEEFREMAAEWFAQAQEEGDEDDDDEEESDDDDDDDDSDDDDRGRIIIRRRLIQRSQSPTRSNQNTRKEMKPSLRHGGCINTACWLDSGWRLSTLSSDQYGTSYNANYSYDFGGEDTHGLNAISSNDCPTQLATSGDDRLVKFWDVRHAMGSANPLPWGRNTRCPFAHEPETIDTEGDLSGYKARWRDFYRKQQQPVEAWKMFGNVQPLATLHTGHRGNVFHVTPLWQQPGKVATCGADGYLRLGDIEAAYRGESNSTTILISPEYFDDGDHIMSGLFSLRPGMCFSHLFLNSNVGLLCSQRGLRKFDVRLPPRQQERRALLGSNTACKACAVWTHSSDSSVEEVDSTYVFVGGTGAEVALCDLRMTGGDSSSENARVVCQYRPRGLEGNDEVSVSGIDLSKDKQELLVSYESDQIYTFPIFPYAKSAAGPTLEEIGAVGNDDADDNAATNGNMAMLNRGERARTGEDVYLNELASYGGHLNRFTFLKNAKYAGPKDEYICTGSDSGHAWIYERATGAVVSLLNADHSTCNGVIPHPTLPIFITYGIDSTAKLWRGTGPVNIDTDDSMAGRAKAFRNGPYDMSSLTREWDSIEQEISNIEQELAEADAAREDDDEDDDDGERPSLYHTYNVLPDQVLSRKELVNTGTFGRIASRGGGSRIGNDLQSLADILRRNQYECIRAAIGGGVGRRTDLPVESDLKELMRRVSLIRLRHQADRQGLSRQWNHRLPWIIGGMKTKENEEDTDTVSTTAATPHPADVVPDNPSDWISFDPEMTPEANACGMSFNIKEYGDFFRDRYLHSDADEQAEGMENPPERVWRRTSTSAESESSPASISASENAYRILHETARVLKDGGNEALREGDLDVAARRYDKAIRYCSIAFMSHRAATTYGGKYEDELTLISMKMLELDIDSDHTVTPLMLKWSPLLKVLVSTRLNLSMLLLNQAKHQPDMPQLEQAKVQARHALRELQPFCTQKGSVCMLFMKSGNVARLCASTTSCKAKVKTEILKSKEPEETYCEAKTLEAKAFFRLGSAQSDLAEYAEAVKSFDRSIECTLDLNPDAKLDPLVVRRLSEAKREKIKQNKRQKKKFRMMFGQEEKPKKEKKAQKGR